MKLETAQRVLALLEFYFYTGHCYRQEVTGRRLQGGKIICRCRCDRASPLGPHLAYCQVVVCHRVIGR